MARIHMPRQRLSDKRWDFTVSSDEEGWAHADGYCAGWQDPDDTEKSLQKTFGKYTIPNDEKEHKRKFKDKFHSDGHATAEEAMECHRQYELDFEIRESKHEDTQKKCQECGEWTDTEVRVGQFYYWWLCATHRVREIYEKLLRARDKGSA